MSVIDQIEIIVKSMTDNNYPAKLVSIVRGYEKEICDIHVNDEVLKNIQCSSLANAGDNALLVYLNGDPNQPFVLLFTDLSKYYTKDEIDEMIGGEIDLKRYVKKEDVKLQFSLEDNGTIIFGIDVGDGF